VNKDPIEKKPLFHFLPGTAALSIATVGCNMDCKFCQNWQISQMRPEQSTSHHVTPEQLAGLAADNGCPSIAYTYTEPVVFYEYMYDCTAAGHDRDVRSVMISNGYIEKEPMRELAKIIDAVKVDLKAFTESFYTDVCVGELKPVLDTLTLLRSMDVWTEIVYLIVPTLNDDPAELKAMCRWIVQELGPDVPVHFSRFHPMYRLTNLPPTPLTTMNTAYDVAREVGLHFVYLGNIPNNKAESTYCPACGERAIHRIGYTIVDNSVKHGACAACGQNIPGVWS
jgi:pyruvate formate lyase activating enzyme